MLVRHYVIDECQLKKEYVSGASPQRVIDSKFSIRPALQFRYLSQCIEKDTQQNPSVNSVILERFTQNMAGKN